MNAKRLIARLTASCLTMTIFFGSAASADSITVNAERLNMRKEASASSKSVGIVEKNDALSFVSEDGEWYQVKDGSKTGFVMKEYVSVDEKEIAADVAANTEAMSASGRAAARINMRRLPMTGSDIVKVVPEKAEVEIIGQCGVWYQVKYSGKTGYLMAQYLTVEENGGSAAPTQPSAPAGQDSIYASALTGTANERLNMRAQPTTASSILRVISKKQTLTVLGENGSWYKVEAGGKTGYVSKEYVSLKQDGSASQPSADTIYSEPLNGAASERVNLREEPSTSADVVKVLSKNQSLTILGENDSWYKVSTGSKTGYISKAYVTLREGASADKEDSLTVYPASRSGVLTDRVNLREAASTTSDVLKVLAKNASVTVLGEQNGFYQVKSGSKTGFVAKAYVALSENAPSVEQDKNEDKNESSSAQDTVYSVAKEGMTTVKVNMRREPEGDVLYTLDADASLLLIGERGGWYLVSWMNTIGYISKAYVTQVISAPSAPTQPDNNTTVKPETPAPDTSGKGTTAYITGSVNMRKGAGTSYGVIKVLSAGTEISYYSLADGWYLVKAGGDTGYVSAKYVTTTKPEASVPSNPGVENVSGKVQQADWWTSNIQKIFARGVIATVTDVDTGISWQVKRSGGSNHADVQPLTAADTAKMKQAYGGSWSWNRRAIWVTINGVSYAASMNGMPHGTGSITTNNFDGHHCIHFLNSRTHTGNRWDTQHQSMVQKAYKAGQ